MARLIVLKEKELRQLYDLLGGPYGCVMIVEREALEESGYSKEEIQEYLNADLWDYGGLVIEIVTGPNHMLFAEMEVLEEG